MARQTLTRNILCLLMALVCNVAWAQPKVSPAPTNGQWADGTTWYQIKTGGGNYFRSDVLNGTKLALTSSDASVTQASLWCITGNETSGYTFYNLAKGANAPLGMTGSEANAYAEFVTDATGYTTAFDFVKSNKADHWCVKEHNSKNNYWNKRGNNLAYWASDQAVWGWGGSESNPQGGDNGSALLFTEVAGLVSLTQLSNTEVYTLQSARAFLFYHPDFTQVVSSTGKAVGTSDEQDGDSDSSFAEPDQSKQLNGTPAENLKAIFEATGPSIITSMGRAMNITDEQYKEIKAFTDNLVSGKPNQTEQYREIFRWIVSNISYGQSDPDPYAVFVNKKCVCQGYTNLLTVMCHTQGIPTVVVNGFLSLPDLYGGHAWAYTNTDGNWEVSDPTNGGSYSMSNTEGYTHLLPSEADVDLFTDDCAVYRYYDYRVNVDKVVAKSNPLIVPYSAGGFVIGSFNPSEALPEEVKDIYLGENIETLGETYNMKLKTSNFGEHLQAIHVDENNQYLMSHKGVVYKRNGDEKQLYYIPGGAETLEFLPMEKVDKETVKDHQNVKVIYFPEGCKSFEDYAIENCPKLEKVYIPEGVDFPSNALYNCPAGVEVIRGSIPNSATLDNYSQEVEVISDNISNSLTLDKTNPNHQFRIEKKDGNYYLYSVGAKKYVAKNGTYTATATDALTLTDVSADRPNYPWQLAIGGNGMNSQDTNRTDEGILFDNWTTPDAGNCYKIEVGIMSDEKPDDGYYLMYSESSSGKGWVHYDSSLSDRKYRVATDVNLSTEVTTEQAQYIWKLVNDSENGTFTLWNLGGNVYMPADASRNANMGATTPANLAIEAVEGEGNEGKWFVSQTNYTNNGNTLYIHTNAPVGYPNLSYWDGKSVDGTSIRAQFTKLPESTYTINYMCGEEKIASTEVSYPTGLAVPETLLQRDVPTGYLVQGNGTLSGTTYTINVVNIFPEAGEYIRIGYDFGTAGVKYMQSTASGVSGKANALLMTDEKGEGSIFLVEKVSGNLRLKSISTGKYLKEDSNNRGLATEGANVTFTEGADGKIKIQATSYLHPNVSGTTYFVDRCSSDGCDQHNLIVEEVTLPDDGGDDGGDDNQEVTSADALPGDGILRYYRLAIGVTKSAYDEDLGSSYDKVKAFWQECEKFVNKMYIPLGMCFDVVVDERLVMSQPNLIDDNIYNATGFGTELLDEAIGSGSYDVGIWVRHCDIYAENTGLAADKGAYSSATKGSAYAMTDKRVVAHEMGHLFGAIHTTYGEGSLMDNPDGEYFSYPIIKLIRDRVKGTQSYKSIEVDNNAPQFDTEKMQKTYRIPQGACLAIDVQATDIENHKLMYTAIGCNSSNVDDILGEYGMMPFFASFAPQESNVISYSPIYTADINYEEDFYLKDGTGIHEMEAGSYPLSILVNDVPSMATWTYTALEEEPFYSTYAIWEAQVEIVGGEAFKAALSPTKTSYTAGETVTVTWGVNKNYFANDSKVRISLSDDYGKTFDYVLAEEVSAHAGFCTVTLPNVNIGQVDVDFTTAVRKMNGGVIKVEEIGGPAFTLTVLDPNNDKGFTVTGGVDAVNKVTSSISSHEIGTFYANEPMTIPAGVTAYVATSRPEMNDTEGSIVMTAISDGIIPAKTGVVIRGSEGTYTFIQAKERGTEVTGNLMRGYAGTKASDFVTFPEDGSVNYVLTVKNGVAGFYRKTAGFNVANHRAYLNVPTEGKANALRIRFADETTEMELPTANGQQPTVIFDLQGRRVLNPTKGMYIVNGKKVVIR